jgi:hypothetical protein
MEPPAFLSPWRVALGLLPLPYAAVLFLEVSGTLLWLGVTAFILFGLLWLVYTIEYPLFVCWPAFSVVFAVVASVIMLYQSVPSQATLPVNTFGA